MFMIMLLCGTLLTEDVPKDHGTSLFRNNNFPL